VLFRSFLEQKKAGAGRACGSKEDEKKEVTIGTLLDWRDVRLGAPGSSSDPA
jgi:hypothetical protein